MGGIIQGTLLSCQRSHTVLPCHSRMPLKVVSSSTSSSLRPNLSFTASSAGRGGEDQQQPVEKKQKGHRAASRFVQGHSSVTPAPAPHRPYSSSPTPQTQRASLPPAAAALGPSRLPLIHPQDASSLPQGLGRGRRSPPSPSGCLRGSSAAGSCPQRRPQAALEARALGPLLARWRRPPACRCGSATRRSSGSTWRSRRPCR